MKLPSYSVHDTRDCQGLWTVNQLEVLSRPEKRRQSRRGSTGGCMEGEMCFRIISAAQHGFPHSESTLTCFTCHLISKLRHGLSERIFLAKMVAKCLEPNNPIIAFSTEFVSLLQKKTQQKCGCVFYGCVMMCADKI